jgi:tRNA (cmo5U34)-methyltransferase
MEFPDQYSPIRLTGEKDELFLNGLYPRPFEFNAEVVAVFDDMVSRSVPMYEDVNRSIAEWSYFHYQPGTRFYDIGCSTGTTIEFVSRHLPHAGEFIGIDASEPMLKKAESKVAQGNRRHNFSWRCEDALTSVIENASFVVINYTLQFLPVAKREHLLRRVFDGMVPGGILYVSEKIRAACPEFEETQTRIYENFKIRAGYSKTEIARKKEALDQVLIPLTVEEQQRLITSVGFKFPELIMKWNNFTSIIAVKK